MAEQGAINALFGFFLNPPYIGLILIFAIIIIYVIYYLFYRKKGGEDYESPKFEEFVPDDLEKKFKFGGKKIKGELMQNLNYIGRIHSILYLRGKFPLMEVDSNKFSITDDYEEYDMIAFKLVSDIPLFRWIGWFKKYAFVDREQLHKTLDPRAKMKVFNVKQGVDFEPYGKNIFLASKHAEEYISNIPIKRSNVAMLQYTADYPDRVVYLDTRHTKGINRLKKAQEIKSESFAKYKKALGDEVDAEYEED